MLEWTDDIACLKPRWSRLAEASGNLFCTWEWASTWWKHFGAEDGPLIALGPGEHPVLVPLYRGRHRGISALRLLGDGLGGRVAPVCHPQQREEARGALAEAIATAPGRHTLFVGQGLPGEDRWDRVLDGAQRQRESSPVLRFDGGSWEDYLKARSRNFRQQVRRRERRLHERHDVRLRLADEHTVSQDLETLFELHGARWNGESDAFAGRRKDFHRDFASVAEQRGWLRLWVLELDGQPAAAWYGFRYGGAEWYYQSGRDPGYDDEAVGFVLLVHTIRSTSEDGVGEYRFLLGDESYKQRFTSEDPGDLTVLAPTGALGRAALALAGARRSARAALTMLRGALTRDTDRRAAPRPAER